MSFIGFVLIPYEILDFDLGINLISESIGIIITVVFLSLLFGLRERKQWKVVKDEVHFHIQHNSSVLFDMILTYVENGYEFKKSLLNIKDKENRKKQIYLKLCKLKEVKKITLDSKMLSKLLEDKILLEYFERVGRRFSYVENKYSKFLSPQLTISLMRIQDGLRILEQAVEMNKLVKTTLEKANKKQLEKVNHAISGMVSVSFMLLIIEIFNIRQRGIEILMP